MRLAGIGAAVIGTGFIGAVHVETLRRLGVTVHGVMASSPERSARRAQELGVERGYESLERLLDDSRVNVVHIASPNNMHHPQAMAALDAGKHVVLEKPLALTSKESADLLARARAAGVVHATQFQLRFYPLNHHLRARVAAGDLGDVRVISGHYLQDWLLNESDWNWRLREDVGGKLRAIGDIGSHWLDLVSFVGGRRLESVMADLTTFLSRRIEPAGPQETFGGPVKEGRPREIDTEDCATMLLRFEGGARGAFTVSQVSPGRKNSLRYEVDGSRAAAAWDSERPDELWIGHRDQPNQLLLRDPSLMDPAAAAVTRLPAGHAEGFADGFRGLQEAVYEAVAAGGPPADPAYPTFADGHEEMLVGDAILRSAAQGAWVDVQRPGLTA